MLKTFFEWLHTPRRRVPTTPANTQPKFQQSTTPCASTVPSPEITRTPQCIERPAEMESYSTPDSDNSSIPIYDETVSFVGSFLSKHTQRDNSMHTTTELGISDSVLPCSPEETIHREDPVQHGDVTAMVYSTSPRCSKWQMQHNVANVRPDKPMWFDYRRDTVGIDLSTPGTLYIGKIGIQYSDISRFERFQNRAIHVCANHDDWAIFFDNDESCWIFLNNLYKNIRKAGKQLLVAPCIVEVYDDVEERWKVLTDEAHMSIIRLKNHNRHILAIINKISESIIVNKRSTSSRISINEYPEVHPAIQYDRVSNITGIWTELPSTAVLTTQSNCKFILKSPFLSMDDSRVHFGNVRIELYETCDTAEVMTVLDHIVTTLTS